MGLIISRFRRKKTTEETLYELDKKLKSMDEYGRSTEQTRRRVVGNLMIASVGLYVLAVLVFYLYCKPTTWTDTVFYSSPLLVSPLLIVLLRAAIARYYDWKLRRNRSRLQIMRTEKKRILEEVMDKETYKVAMGLLAKFANTEMEKPLIQLARPISAPSKSLLPALNAVATPAQLRRRQIQGPVSGMAPSPQRALMPASPNQLTPLKGDQLPRPIMNSNTSGAFERLVDYLIGDGPGSRYALICSNCKSHNGMAMPEEFEYVAYRCAYCRHPNAARKTRPRPPQLMSTPINTDTSENTSQESQLLPSGASETMAFPSGVCCEAEDHKSSSESEDSEEEKTPSKTPEPSSNNSPNKTVEMAESPPPADDVPEDMSIDEPSENHSSDAGDKKKTD